MTQQVWTRERIIQALQHHARELGHTPPCWTRTHPEYACSYTLVRLRFGSWRAAILAAGLTPRPPGLRISEERRQTVEVGP